MSQTYTEYRLDIIRVWSHPFFEKAHNFLTFSWVAWTVAQKDTIEVFIDTNKVIIMSKLYPLWIIEGFEPFRLTWVWDQGKTWTLAFNLHKSLIWLNFIPKSYAAILNFPFGLYIFTSFIILIRIRIGHYLEKKLTK